MQTECTCVEDRLATMAQAIRDFDFLHYEQQVQLLKDLLRMMTAERQGLLGQRDRLLLETRSQREELATLRARLRVLTEF
jgi:hypothetical protein